METASPLVRCIVRTEVGNSGNDYDPYSVGDNGTSFGPVQLHKWGLLAEYLAWSGGASPFNPYRAVEFAEHVVAQGRAANWSGVKWGLC